jgi:pimeloyl-ACP methyl ester carboxylesterase/membrane protein DedA with SNARE-associated domain
LWQGSGSRGIETQLDAVEVPARSHDGTAVSGKVRIAWEEWGLANETAMAVPVVLLHGSPGSHQDFRTLGPALARSRRVLAPDLTGFGESTLQPPSLSITAQAAHVDDWLEHLEIERAHVLGFSMGGGVALELGERHPRRVASLTLLSSLGVEELELLGDHQLNHGMHLLALWATQAVDLLVPHFGSFDRFPLGVAWARQFAETDQRRVRPILERWSGPALILHGRHDPLIPLAAARESARLLPQAELIELDTDHFLVFSGGDRLADHIAPFLDRADAGQALRREQAPRDRLEAAARPWDPRVAPAAEGFAVGLAAVLLALSTLISEDLASITGGLLASQGRLSYLTVTIACGAGIFVGDIALFLVGRTLGRAALRRRPLSWFVDASRLEHASEWFRRRGAIVILASRFTPGTRLATYLTAGVLRTPWWTFVGWFALSVALWTPLLVGAAMLFGTRLEGFLQRGLPALILSALLLVVVVRSLMVPALTHRGRRRLLGRWRRLTRWEFWPAWAVYPPVVVWILIEGVRRRGLTWFTACNPGFPNAGGLIGESKSAILRLLPAEDPRVPPWTVIEPGGIEERLRALQLFLRDHHLDYPVVLKPDVGERGQGVHICRNPDQALTALGAHPVALIAQEYLPGIEVGAFWIRGWVGTGPRGTLERPGLFALTDKRVPHVTGDGRRTAEELVYDDPRAVIMADQYLENLGPRAFETPAAGEEVILAELGTHCRGAIFLDGEPLVTAELAAAVDDLSRRVEGFHFGRWDLRAASREALQRGELRVVELNGLTSEATVIYDPSYSLLDGWKVLIRQWTIAIDIGMANARAGAPVVGLSELASLVWHEWRSRRVPTIPATAPARSD